MPDDLNLPIRKVGECFAYSKHKFKITKVEPIGGMGYRYTIEPVGNNTLPWEWMDSGCTIDTFMVHISLDYEANQGNDNTI